MQPPNQPASKTRIALTWLFLIANIVFWCAFWFWRSRGRATPHESGPLLFHSIFMIVSGGFLLAVGVGAYLLTILTCGLTFDFTRPVWGGLKGRLFLANILVPIFFALGLGCLFSAFISPVLTALGTDDGIANLLPMMAIVAIVQVVQLWVLVWAPLERRVIARRLAALGITPPQLAGGTLVGLSNPASGLAKRFATIEEDMGALWVSQDQLVFWGDGEQFGLTRDQIIQIERKVDARSTTMLCGLAHVILHVRQSDGSERLIRLHVEGLWTMGQKRRMMERLSDMLSTWHAAAVPA